MACLGCGASNKLLACSRCGTATFCGSQCQQRVWPEHRISCWRPKEAEIAVAMLIALLGACEDVAVMKTQNKKQLFF
jgi:hypothetical protein